MKIREDGFFIVHAFMVNDLNLKGNELLTYAIIYGYSKDENKYFTGSLSYLMAWTGISSKTTVLNILKNLTEKELLIKREVVRNNVKYCEYKVVKKIIKEDLKEDLICENNLENSNLGSKEILLGSREIDMGYIKNSYGDITKIGMGISKIVPNNIDKIYINKINNNIYKEKYKKEKSTFVLQKHLDIFLKTAFP